MLCAAAPEYISNIKGNTNDDNHNSLKKSSSKATKGKAIFNEPDNTQEPLLKDLSLAFSTNDNNNGNISFNNQHHDLLNENDNEQKVIRNYSNESNHSSSIVDLPLANGSSSSLNLNVHDISKLSYDDIPYHSGMSLSCSSIRPVEQHNNSKSSIDNGSHFSEDESFVYNSHLSEIDRNEDIKDLRIKLKKAIKSLDKKKKGN
ncbi:hypothetical protein PIROE2DRAFT_3982 [Piromyces sp. E2]|nr:hypothetical protein PIROE2DRAFT_3982 [Piromyces sp. E2]|eukprot:OUM68381.1 hypothetical protein PIROE2DRAFT_3982 [Piromyces sp. E2]